MNRTNEITACFETTDTRINAAISQIDIKINCYNGCNVVWIYWTKLRNICWSISLHHQVQLMLSNLATRCVILPCNFHLRVIDGGHRAYTYANNFRLLYSMHNNSKLTLQSTNQLDMYTWSGSSSLFISAACKCKFTWNVYAAIVEHCFPNTNMVCLVIKVVHTTFSILRPLVKWMLLMSAPLAT